jgi:hypothetical protein
VAAHLVSCGDFAPGIGGDFERECARQLRAELPDGYLIATNVTLDRGGGSFLECDAVVAGPGIWVICEMKSMRRVEVFEDLLRGAAQFAVDRVFSTLDLKAKVLGGRRQRAPFPSGSAHMEGRVRTLVVVPDYAEIVFQHRAHRENHTVMTLGDAIVRFATFATESGSFANMTAQRELRRGWEAYCQASMPSASRSLGQLGRYRVRRQLTSRSKSVREFYAVDEPPSRAEVRLREFELDPTMPAQELEADLERLAREMTVLRKIRHPYVACITGHFQTGCSWVEVSDWFDGQALEEMWLSLRDASILERADVFLKVVAALEYCHERGVFHRNVSAESVLVSPDLADVRLSGFNLARDLAATSTLTSGLLVSRDARLVPPEELRGAPAANARLGDVFQAGVLLYRLLEDGAWPFSSTLDYATNPGAGLRTFGGTEEPETMPLRALARRMIAVDPATRPDQLKRVESEIRKICAAVDT